MLVEKYLKEAKQFNKKSNKYEELKDAFFYSKIFEYFMLFIVYAVLVCFSFKALNDSYNINEFFLIICVEIFFCLYIPLMELNGVFKKNRYISAEGSFVFILSLEIFFILLAIPFQLEKYFITGIIIFLPLFTGIYFYFVNKYKSSSCSYSLIEKEEKIIAIKKNKIEEMKTSILENKNHKKEAIDYLLDRKNDNKELSFEEIELKDIILENEEISVHKDFFILEGIIKENNRKEEICIKNT